MGVRVACAYLDDQLDLRLRDRAHRHHDRPMEAASGTAEKVGDEHRHQGAEFNVAHPDPRLDQGVLKGQAAAEQEGDEVVAPQVADLCSLFDQLASAVNAVAGQIGAQVGPRGRAGWLRIAGRCDLDQRARLGVADAEGGELGRRLLWQDDEVCLLVGRALPSGAAMPFAVAGRRPHLGRRCD